jgi:hypothetical protein
METEGVPCLSLALARAEDARGGHPAPASLIMISGMLISD